MNNLNKESIRFPSRRQDGARMPRKINHWSSLLGILEINPNGLLGTITTKPRSQRFRGAQPIDGIIKFFSKQQMERVESEEVSDFLKGK
jgi:hypothetical protein